MSELKNKIIKKIKTGEVKKTSRWYFLTKKYTIWSVFVISIFFGALSFSILLNNIFDEFGPWYKLKVETSLWLSNILWIWILSLLVFVFVAVVNFKQTKKAFKFHTFSIVLVSILISLFLGGILYSLRVGKVLDKKIIFYNHNYKKMKEERKKTILKFLRQNNIDEKEFFENQEIVKLREKWAEIDKERIERLKEILEKYKGKKEEKELRGLFDKIKEKKREVDYQRFLKEVEIYKESVLK